MCKKYEKLKEKYEKIKNKHKNLEEEYEKLEDKHEELEDEYENLRCKHNKSKEKHKRTENKYEELGDEHEELKNKYEILRCKHNKSKEKHKRTENKYEELGDEHEELKNKYEILREKKNKIENKNNNKTKKGHLCSVMGMKYEKVIHDIVKNCNINNNKFNTQNIKELGGSTHKNDIECNFKKNADIGIEIKKYNTPDWMQCGVKFNNETKEWNTTKNNNMSKKTKEIFDNIIKNVNIFNGRVPPFVKKSITHQEWIKIKKNTNKWNDEYIKISDDTIRKLYNSKGCKYIQISGGYGLYHLGNDICDFGVPEFNVEQQMRIRTKIHSSKNKNGFCQLSVTISCQPKNIKYIEKSQYSLDDVDNLPLKLNFINQ
jgi:hypothetical protein